MIIDDDGINNFLHNKKEWFPAVCGSFLKSNKIRAVSSALQGQSSEKRMFGFCSFPPISVG